MKALSQQKFNKYRLSYIGNINNCNSNGTSQLQLSLSSNHYQSKKEKNISISNIILVPPIICPIFLDKFSVAVAKMARLQIIELALN